MKTFPCIRGKIGDWSYYVTTMSMAELVNSVKFADQIFPRDDLDQIMQRELTERSSDIEKYLLSNEQRFMGSLIVSAVGGEPKFVPVTFGEEDAYSFANGKIGFLRFDGSENYYVLDGQHRLAAIKDALTKDYDKLSKDEVSMIIVWHDNNEVGRTRARRLFTTVNRYAKKTSRTEDIVFDEDNPIDIYTRRLIREHPFLIARTKVTNLASPGEFKLAKSESLIAENKYDKKFLFSLLTLRRCNEILLKKCFLDPKVKPQILPEFDVLEEGYNLLIAKWNILIENVVPWKEISGTNNGLDNFRMKNGGNPLVRPIAIIAFVEAAATLMNNNGEIENIKKVSRYFSDITVFPLKGLLWKEDKGGMHDGQARRNAAASLFSYYLNNEPTRDIVIHQWESAAGREIPEDLPDRETILR